MNQEKFEEIDLIEVLKNLWDGKWIIILCVVLFTIAAYSSSQRNQQSVYFVSAPFYFDNHLILNKSQTYHQNLFKILVAQSNSGLLIDLKNSKATMVTSTPMKKSDIESQFKDIEDHFTNVLENEAVNEVIAIKELIALLRKDNSSGAESYKATAPFVGRLLNANRVIQMIKSSKKAVKFGSVSMLEKPHNPKVNIVLFGLLGGIIGCLIVVIRKIYFAKKN